MVNIIRKNSGRLGLNTQLRSEGGVNPVPETILSDFWMTHSFEYHQAVKVRGRLVSALCAAGMVLAATLILGVSLTIIIWLIFRAEFLLCLIWLLIFCFPFVVLEQIFRRTYESVRMGFDRKTIISQAIFGRTLGCWTCLPWRYW